MFIPKGVTFEPDLLIFMVVIRFLICLVFFSLGFLCLAAFFFFFLAHFLTSMLHHQRVQPWSSPGILSGRNLTPRRASTHVICGLWAMGGLGQQIILLCQEAESEGETSLISSGGGEGPPLSGLVHQCQ